jgi:hypothetical protein
LADSRQSRILHVFDRACNLINEKREVVSIVTPKIGNGPFNLVLAEEMSFSQDLDVDSLVSIADDRLIVGDLIFNTHNVPTWDPCPDWEKLHLHREAIVSRLRALQISSYDRLISDLSSVLVSSDIQEAKAIAQRLAGLGHGLTPAGDDFLMGAIYAAWIMHPPDVAGEFASQIVTTAAPLTTSLSAAWLIAAGKGEAGILWHHFFEAFLSADHARSQEALDRILTVGETSGADVMAGFLGTVSALDEVKHS